MISRVCRVGVALAASLMLASACMAADVSPANPSGNPLAILGKGGIGGQLGVSTFKVDRVFGSQWFGDYSEGARPRFSFESHWRYQVRPWLRWQVGTGFTWAGYKQKTPAPFKDLNFPSITTKSEYLTLMLPVTAQVQYTYRSGRWNYYGGGGPGVYRVWVEDRRKVLKDPVTLKLHRGLYPGGSAQFGVERFFTTQPSTSLEATVSGHLALAQRHDQFVSGFDSNVMALEVRMGANYYFTPGPRKVSPANKPTKSP